TRCLRKGTRELPLELGHLFRAEPDGDRHLSRLAAVGSGADAEDGAARLDHRSDRGLDRRGDADAAVDSRVLVRPCVRRILPQHAAAGAAVSVVLRAAGTVAARRRSLAEATA